MKIERFKATFVLATIVLMAGCINQAKAGAPSELAQIGDFSISLTDIKREKNTTTLHFAITKVSDTDSGHQSLQVTLMDDHRNEYSGNLDIRLEGASDVVLNALSKGFTYVDTVSISMPKIAPIETIKLGDIKEIAFKKVKFGKPQFMKNFGHLAITKGQSVAVGKWLSFTMEQILPALSHWELPITVENKEYNPFPSGVRVAVQHGDGTISWSGNEFTTVPALSKTLVKVALPIGSWVKGGLPQPKALLNLYSDRSPGRKGEAILKMFPITPNDLPPLVGQGPKEIEDVFLEAYKRNGGQKTMGNPLNLPHWFAGGSQPKDENDILIQEFPPVSKFGKSAIIWDKQANAKEAYVLHGKIWEKYSTLGGPYTLGPPAGAEYKSPITGYPQCDFERGYVGTWDGTNYKMLPYGVGKIALFVFTNEGERNTGSVYVTKPDGSDWRKIGPSRSRYRPYLKPAWSPDGHKVAFAYGYILSDTELHVVDIKTKQTQKLQTFPFAKFHGVTWSPDGTQLAYVKSTKRNKEERSFLQLVLHNIDGSGTRILTQLHWSASKEKYILGLDFEEHWLNDPAWSPDGTRIAFDTFSSRYSHFIYSYEARPGDIYIVDVASGTLTQLTRGPGANHSPAWSPNGKRIAFVSTRDGNHEIYVMDADGTNQSRVTYNAAADYLPEWSPDGTAIAFVSEREGKEQIYIVDLESKIGRRLTRSITKNFHLSPAWSR